MFLGDALEIGGIVIAGKRILLAAEIRDKLREFALRIGLGALEHQMFEEMRDAGLARRIVGGAVAIPNHMRHDRRAVIRDDDDIQAICELCLRNRRPRRFALRLRRMI